MPKILFIAALHGNEAFSVKVLEKLEEKYPRDKYNYDWIIGNPEAVKQGVRYTERDLNRSAPGDSQSDYYEERRAAELIKLTSNYDFVIDIHGAMTDCGLVKIIPYPTPENIQLARAIPIKKNVIWYAEESNAAGPISQHSMCPAIEIECGPKNDPKVALELGIVLEKILDANAKGSLDPFAGQQEFYNVYGLQKGERNPNIRDFKLVNQGKEAFYPFLSSNQYNQIACYKMERLDLSELQKVVL
jgi:predicted deacylase